MHFLTLLKVIRFLKICSFLVVFITSINAQQSSDKVIPDELKQWSDWATWDDLPEGVPSHYNNARKKAAIWPSSLDLSADEEEGAFSYQVEVFHDSWVSLPGSREAWPLSVKANGESIAVLNKNQLPSIYLKPGSWTITGEFRWAEMPQTLVIPKTIGILDLVRGGERIAAPSWDNSGRLWLKRTTKEAVDKNYLSAQVYRNLVDGAPMWLHTDVELTVTGKSREEELGAILPVGWNVSSIKSQIPCALDGDGLLKAQVRAGKWVISIAAFRTTPVETMTYAEGVKPLVETELVSLKSQPNFRIIEFTEISAVDVAQTTFPSKWRNLPVHLWENGKSFKVIEKMRGMGQKKPAGISINREFWLDESGDKLTYRDVIAGSALQTWRLDAADGQELGAAKIGNDSQLITKNPLTGAKGVEIRVRNLQLQSVGRMDRKVKVSATGWQHDAESLQGRLYVPPGWRVLAVFGPDSSYGDWLTSWSLLDVFFLLIFTVAISRLWGWKLGLLAFVAFVLSYHEEGMPRFTWVLLLIGLALFRAVSSKKSGKLKAFAKVFTYASVGLVLLGLVPFVKTQVQQALYPQLESHFERNISNSGSIQSLSVPATPAVSFSKVAEDKDDPFGESSNLPDLWSSRSVKNEPLRGKKNLKYDSKAKIQTGPAVPEWSWRSVSFDWSGPVSADEEVSFVLIPLWLQRIITILRVILLIALLYLLVGRLKGGSDFMKTKGKASTSMKSGVKSGASVAVMICVAALSFPSSAQAQYPDADILKTLRERLLNEDKEITQFAEIPELELLLDGTKLSMEVIIHTAKKTAVPLPGKLPVWSPISVKVEGVEKAPVSRINGYLWVVLEAGTHRVIVDGLVPTVDWEWSFLLKPQYVDIRAKGWTVTGVKPNGIPENQVFFVQQNKKQSEETGYDRKDFNPILSVSRSIELGLIWQSKTTVRRLSPLGKAVSVSLPLLPGERILSSDLTSEKGRVEIRLGAQQREISWGSELAQSPTLLLASEKNDHWVEQWQVIASSVWNLNLGGLEPIFQNHAKETVPIWKPWPGESVTLNISRPEAVVGETMTIRKATHEMNMGSRQRTSTLNLSVQTSLGTDFIMDLSSEAKVTSLKLNSAEIPVRKEGSRVIVPLRPGEQDIELIWKTPTALSFKSLADEVTLPVNCANTSTVISLSPDDRWVLWANGPRRGPAVSMWSVFIFVIIFGLMLGKIKVSPLKSYEWIFLLLGLSQVSVIAGFFIVGWLFWVALRGAYSDRFRKLPSGVFNLNQLIIIGGLIPVIIILLMVLHKGLLGSPEMRVLGEDSRAGSLKWFEAIGEGSMLPMPWVISVSIWFYRGLMLLWAVWLSFALLRWARCAFDQLGNGGFWKKMRKEPNRMSAPIPAGTPPEIPSVKKEEAKKPQS